MLSILSDVNPSQFGLLVACFLFVLGCEPGHDAGVVTRGEGETHQGGVRREVVFLAASSTTNAAHEIAELFERQHPDIDVLVSTGSSNALARQIVSGAPADVFLSANRKWAEAVIAAEGGEMTELLRNRIVLVVPKGNPAGVEGPEDVTDQRVSRVAIASENVPAGIYAEQALAALQLLAPLQRSGKLARGSDARITLAYIERGEAEAGLVYATDASLSDLVELIVEIEPQTHAEIIYPAVLLTEKTPTSRDFYRFLTGPEARAVFARFGFEMVPVSQGKGG